MRGCRSKLPGAALAGFGLPSACPAKEDIPSYPVAGFSGRRRLGELRAASPCPKQLSGFRTPKALLCLVRVGLHSLAVSKQALKDWGRCKEEPKTLL